MSVQYLTPGGYLLSEEDLANDNSGLSKEELIEQLGLTVVEGETISVPNEQPTEQPTEYSAPKPRKYIEVNNQQVFEDDYTKKYAGKPIANSSRTYPNTFEEYAKAHKQDIKVLKPGDLSFDESTGILLDEVVVSDTEIPRIYQSNNRRPTLNKPTYEVKEKVKHKDYYIYNTVTKEKKLGPSDYENIARDYLEDINSITNDKDDINRLIAIDYFGYDNIKEARDEGIENYQRVYLKDKKKEVLMTEDEILSYLTKESTTPGEYTLPGYEGKLIERLGPVDNDFLLKKYGKNKAKDFADYIENGFLNIEDSKEPTIFSSEHKVITDEKDKLVQNFDTYLSEEDKEKITPFLSYIGLDDTKSLEAYNKRLKDEKDWEKITEAQGRSYPLLTKKTIYDPFSGKVRTFEPVSSMAGGPDFRKSIKHIDKEIKERTIQLETDAKQYYDDVVDYNTKIQPYQDKFEKLEKDLLDLGDVDENSSPEIIEKYNSIVQEIFKVKDEVLERGLDKTVLDLAKRQKILDDQRNQLFKRSQNFESVSIAVNAARLNYNWFNRTALQLEKAFLGGSAILGSGTLKLLTFGQSDDINLLYQQSIDYNKRLEQNLHDNYERHWKVGETGGWNYFSQALADQSPSILTVLLPTGAARALTSKTLMKTAGPMFGATSFEIAKRKGKEELFRRIARRNAYKIATKLTMGGMFVQSGGASLANSEIRAIEAPDVIAHAEKQLKTATPDKVDYWKKIIANAEAYRDANFYQKALNAGVHGTIEMFAEKVGTLRYLQNARMVRTAHSSLPNPVFRFLHRGALNTWGLTKTAGRGILIEEMEELITQFGQNASDIVIMGQDKSLMEGVDPDFFARTAITSFVLQGGNIGNNLWNMISNEVRNADQIKINKANLNEWLGIQVDLQDPKVTGKKKIELRKRAKEILQESAMNDMITVHQLSKLSPTEVKNLFEHARLARKSLNAVYTAQIEGATREEIENLKEEYRKHEANRNKLASKYKQEQLEKFRKAGELDPAETFHAKAIYDLTSDMAKMASLQKGKGYFALEEDFNLMTPTERLDFMKNLSDKYGKNWTEVLDKIIKKEYAFEVDGNIFVNKAAIDLALIQGNKTEALIAAASPLHEVLHDELRKVGIDTGKKISRYALNAVRGLYQMVENDFKAGKVSEEAWKTFQDRFKLYEQDGKYKQYLELITLVNDMVTIGALKPSMFNELHDLKSWMHALINKYSKDSKVFYPFETPQDVFRYINRFQEKAREGAIGIAARDEDEEKIKTDINVSRRSVDEIYEKEGAAGYEQIISTMRPLIAKWVDKHSQRPDFDTFRDIIIEDALTGPNGVLDMIIEYEKYVEKQKKLGEDIAPIGAFINNALSPNGLNKIKNIIDNRLGQEFKQSTDRTDQEGKKTTPELIDYSDKTGEIEFAEEQTGELRKLLGIETNGRIYNKVLKEVTESLRTELPDIHKDPVKFRQELEKRFIKAFTKVIKEKIGTQKSKKFRDFITNEDNIKMLQDLFAIKYKTRAAFSFMTQNAKEVIGGTGRMSADLSRKMQTSLRGSFVSDQYGGNTVWVPVKVTPEMMINEIIMETKKSGKPGDTKYKGIIDVLAMELGLDATFDALTADDLDINKLKGVIGKVAEAIKRDPTINFSRNLYAAGRKNPKILEQFQKGKERFYDELEKINSYDKKGIRQAFNSVWNKKEHPDLWEIREVVLNDWANYLKPFNLVDPKFKDPETRKNIDEVFELALKDIDQNQDLAFLFGVKDITSLFNNPNNIRKQVKLADKMLEDLVEEFGQKQGVDIFMNFFLPQFQHSGKVGSGLITYDIKSGNYIVNKDYVKQKAKEGKKLQPRTSILENNKKTYILLKLEKYGIVMGEPGKKSIKGKGKVDAIINTNQFFRIEKDENGNDVYVKVKVTGPKQSAAAIQEAMDGDVNMEERKTDVKLARKYIKWQMKWMSDKVKDKSTPWDKNNFAMLMAGLLGNMDTALRKAGLLKYTPEVWNYKKTKDYEYEHMIPARVIALFLAERYFNGNRKINIDKLFENYDVAIIEAGTKENKRMNEIVGELYKQKMISGWMPGDSSLERYYNEFLLGKNVHAIKDIETGDVYGKFHEIVWKGIKNGSITDSKDIQLINNIVKALNTSSKAPRKGISVIDFDDTLAITDSKVIVTETDGSTYKLTPAEFAQQYDDLVEQDAKFDFKEFNVVKKGKKGPFFDKAKALKEKFGNNDIFILTARPQESAKAIQKFLKGVGLNIKLENIIGLEDGKPEAKANWMIGKVAEGYNDFLFADDQIKNVKAVKAVLDQFDVKSDVREANMNFSRRLNENFNKILEDNKGLPKDAKYSRVVAKRMGAKKGKFQFYLPPNAEDFKGLLYAFLGYGKKGEQQFAFLKKALIDPYNRGIAALNLNKQEISSVWKSLLKAHPEVKKLLSKLIPGTEFTYDHAIRVWMWNKAGIEIPGLSKRDTNKLLSIVNKDQKLINFANDLLSTRPMKNGFPEPDAYWDVGTLLGDLNNSVERVSRKELLKEFIENHKEIFNEDTLNKIEAIYGNDFRESLEDMLWRMENGTNRSFGKNALVNEFMDWINNSVGAVMFINVRSATLQSISIINFLNWSDNNPMAAAQAFANQPQFWKDFIMIWNSPKLKARRRGLQLNVQEQELANAAKKGGYRGMLAYLLRIGFTPTQVVDSFAIAFGGASMYRNRVNTYKKQGLDQKAAEEKAFKDFSATAEETQQSGDPMLISRVQASELGRVIFAWQNTPFQYNRLMKRAGQDLINRRRMPGLTQAQSDATYISKILYYGMIQNFVFSALQNALFAMLPGFTGDEDPDEEKQQLNDAKKLQRIVNNMADTILRGSGLPGAIISTIKNIIIEYNKQNKKGFLADHVYTMGQIVNLSPPLGAKYRKVYNAIQTGKFEKDVIAARGWAPDSPIWEALASVVTAGTNIPLDRAVMLSHNMVGVTDSRHRDWQRVAMALGWPAWSVGADIFPEHEIIKQEAKERRKQEGIEKAKRTREQNRLNKTPAQLQIEAYERALKRAGYN